MGRDESVPGTGFYRSIVTHTACAAFPVQVDISVCLVSHPLCTELAEYAD